MYRMLGDLGSDLKARRVGVGRRVERGPAQPDDVASLGLVAMAADRLLLVEVGVHLDPPLLHQDAAVVLLGSERAPAEVAFHRWHSSGDGSAGMEDLGLKTESEVFVEADAEVCLALVLVEPLDTGIRSCPHRWV